MPFIRAAPPKHACTSGPTRQVSLGTDACDLWSAMSHLQARVAWQCAQLLLLYGQLCAYKPLPCRTQATSAIPQRLSSAQRRPKAAGKATPTAPRQVQGQNLLECRGRTAVIGSARVGETARDGPVAQACLRQGQPPKEAALADCRRARRTLGDCVCRLSNLSVIIITPHTHSELLRSPAHTFPAPSLFAHLPPRHIHVSICLLGGGEGGGQRNPRHTCQSAAHLLL